MWFRLNLCKWPFALLQTAAKWADTTGRGFFLTGRPGDFPVASREYKRYLSLPIFPGMTGAQIDYVIENVLEIVKHAAR